MTQVNTFHVLLTYNNCIDASSSEKEIEATEQIDKSDENELIQDALSENSSEMSEVEDNVIWLYPRNGCAICETCLSCLSEKR